MQISIPEGNSGYFYLVGVNHRTLSVADREMLTQLEQRSSDLLPSIVSQCGLQEAALLSTCNRFEVIGVAPRQNEPAGDVSHRIIECLRSSLERPVETESFYRLMHTDAIRHVFRVSSSLDSMVLGEAQILGQVKGSYERAVKLGLAGKYLHHLFQYAFHLAKKVRAHTEVGSGGVSISYVAVRLAEQIFGSLSSRSVLIIGSGEMAELAALHLKSRGCGAITVANRTIERATELAARIGGSAISLGELDRHIDTVDVVIGSISIDRPFLDMGRATRMLGKRPQFFIDLGVPRNFPEALGSLDNVYLYNVDDLARISDENRGLREEAAKDAEIILEHGMFQFQRWLVKVSAEPAVRDFRSHVHEICREEVKHRLSPQLPESERQVIVEELAHRISQKISHRMTKLLSASPQGEVDPENVLPFLLRDLFEK